MSNSRAARIGKFTRDAEGIEQSKRYYNIRSMVHNLELFDEPMEGESWPFYKGESYIAAVVFSQDWDRDEALARLTHLKENWKGTLNVPHVRCQSHGNHS